MSAADFDVKIMLREELEAELEMRRGEHAASSEMLDKAGVPEIVIDENHDQVWRALALRISMLIDKLATANKRIIELETDMR